MSKTRFARWLDSTSFAQWLADRRWAANMVRARRWQRRLDVSARQRFFDALRPVRNTVRLAYPDAIFYVGIDDLCRAMRASARFDDGPPKPRAP